MIQAKSKARNKSKWENINAARVIASTFGALFGVSGIGHGFFETLQGNIPTNGMWIAAIGEANRMWVSGSEPAFTLIPNFLITGIAAIIVGLAIIIWSIGFVHKKNGPLILLLLFMILTLVGGGVAHILIFPIICAFATRINKPLIWWQRILTMNVRRILSKLWFVLLTVSSLAFIFTLEIAIFGFVPGVNDSELITTVMLSSVGIGIVTIVFAFISGFAHDINRQKIL